MRYASWEENGPAPDGAADGVSGAAGSQGQRERSAQTRFHELFGMVSIVAMHAPHYQQIPFSEIGRLLGEPIKRNRVALAFEANDEPTGRRSLAGIAIWATVSGAVDATIRGQIADGVFPVRLAPDDWASGEINWLLDVIAPSRDTGTKVLANLSQVITGPTLHIHPVVGRMVDVGALEEIGAVLGHGKSTSNDRNIADTERRR